jgi:hypothetical protein
MKMLKEEEIYWRQRSHETWLLKGDGNNGFFTKLLTMGRGKIILSWMK